MHGYEIRRIRVEDARAVVELWDRMCREIVDGGPLTATGRDNLERMLAASAWHRDTFCLVAEGPGGITGFGLGHLDTGDGLLPGAVGQVQELWAEPGPDRDAVKRALAEAVIARLRADGGRPTLRKTLDAEDPAEQAFWRSLGFVADMVVMSSYPG